MPDDRDARLDEAVDLAARGLTSGDPGAAFRARVLARLAERRPRRMRRAMFALAAVGAAAIAGVLVWPAGAGRHGGPPARATATATVPVPPRIAAEKVSAAPSREPAASSAPAPGGVRVARAAGAPLPARAPASAIDALRPDPLVPDSIAVAPLTIEAIEPIGSIELSTLTVPSIGIAPLATDDRPEPRRPL
jgi:hypothetical protein